MSERTLAKGETVRAGAIAFPTGSAQTVALKGDVRISDKDLSNETVTTGAANLTTKIGDSWRVGGFTTLSRPSNRTLWAVGTETHRGSRHGHSVGSGGLWPVERPGRRPLGRAR